MKVRSKISRKEFWLRTLILFLLLRKSKLKIKNKKNKTINVTFSQKLFVFTFVFPFVSVSSFFLFSCRMEKTNIKLSSEKVTLMSKFFEKLFSRELCNSNCVWQNTEFPIDIQRRKKRAKIFSFSIPAQILCVFGRNNRFQIKILKLSSWRRAWDKNNNAKKQSVSWSEGRSPKVGLPEINENVYFLWELSANVIAIDIINVVIKSCGRIIFLGLRYGERRWIYFRIPTFLLDRDCHRHWIDRVVFLFFHYFDSQVGNDGVDVPVVLQRQFLVMAPTLFWVPAAEQTRHFPENFGRPPHELCREHGFVTF